MTNIKAASLKVYTHVLDLSTGVILEHGGDVSQRCVPLHQRLGVGRCPRQRQSVVFRQPLVDLQNVSSGTVYFVRRLLAGDERPQVLVVQLQKSTTRQEDTQRTLRIDC